MWIAFFSTSSHFYSEHTVQKKKKEEILTSRRPESSQSGVHQKNNSEETWKIQTGEISRHFDALLAFLHTSATSLIAAFDFHYCVTVTSCYSWWTSTTIRHQRRRFGSWSGRWCESYFREDVKIMFVSDTVGCKHAVLVFQSNAVEDNGFLLHNQADLHKPNLFFESFNSHTNNIWHVLTNLFCRLAAINASKKACPPDSPLWHEMTASFASNY